MPGQETVFVLQRLNWQRHGTGDGEGWVRLPGRVRLQSFPDLRSAEDERRRREEGARERVNPFACGGPGLSILSTVKLGPLVEFFTPNITLAMGPESLVGFMTILTYWWGAARSGPDKSSSPCSSWSRCSSWVFSAAIF